MVERLKTILATMERTKGNVALFSIVKMDELTDRWTVLLAASWVGDSEQEAFAYVVDQLVKNLDLKHLQTIARVGVYTPDEHLATDLLKYKKGTHITETIKANGNTVHEAYIIQSRGSS